MIIRIISGKYRIYLLQFQYLFNTSLEWYAFSSVVSLRRTVICVNTVKAVVDSALMSLWSWLAGCLSLGGLQSCLAGFSSGSWAQWFGWHVSESGIAALSHSQCNSNLCDLGIHHLPNKSHLTDDSSCLWSHWSRFPVRGQNPLASCFELKEFSGFNTS